jgi:hypothetical protein
LDSRAVVSTTATVVFCMPNGAAGRSTAPAPPAIGCPSAASTSPQALTTATAATSAAPARIVAHPTPPGSRRPRQAPVDAPAPAPTRPVASGSPRQAASAAARPAAASGGPVPTEASNTDMPTTMGTGPAGVGKPRPRSRSRPITPSAAARPNAEPPESTTASTRSTRRVGSSSANSRVAGAPPRTSPEATVPAGGRMTVTPVPAPVQCPAQADNSCGSVTARPSHAHPGATKCDEVPAGSGSWIIAG